MNLEEIKEFLKNKQGYLKEGGKRLRRVLLKKGFTTTVAQCKTAIREVREELKFSPIFKNKEEAKILFYDIEVSYGIARVWRPGWKIQVGYSDFLEHGRIICISYKWSNSDEVHTVRWDKHHDDKALLEVFINELNKADFIVAHNGDKFDLPWIRTRALFHNIEMLPKYKSVDTLKISRYRHKFPSNRLDDLGEYLGLGRKIRTDRDLWVRTIEGNEKDSLLALNEMTLYCEQDVILLEKVYDKLSSQELPTIHIGTLKGETKQTSPYNGKTNLTLIKTTTSRAGTRKHLMKCLDTNKYFEFSDTDYRKYIEINDGR